MQLKLTIKKSAMELEQHDKSNKRPRTIADFFMVSLSSMRNLTSALGPSLISLW
jgi:hypothetical protein